MAELRRQEKCAYRLDAGTEIVTEERGVIADMVSHGEQVLEAHRAELCRSDLEEQIDAHLESSFPEVHALVRRDVVEQLMAEAFDPVAWCHGGHRGPADCDCGEYAE